MANSILFYSDLNLFQFIFQSAYSQMHASAAFILSADAPCGVHMVNNYIEGKDSGLQHSCIATFQGGTTCLGVELLNRV